MTLIAALVLSFGWSPDAPSPDPAPAIVQQAPTPSPSPSPTPAGGAAEAAARKLKEKGLGWLLGLAALGGLISLIMPCVYPLIPITLTYFLKQGGGSRAAGLRLSAVYGLGIIIAFTGLGFLLTLLLGASGARQFAAHPVTNLAVSLLFGVFALSMFGLFEIKLPDSWTGALTGGGPKSGLGGAFLLGLLFSVVTFTCTIPIAATVLAVAASGGSNSLAGLLAMLVYSTTMAAPFLVLGFFPSMIKEIPKSGGWMHTVKVVTGFFEIALAVGYIWKADLGWGWGFFDRWNVLALWISVCLIAAAYLLGLFRMKGDGETREVGLARMGAALVFAFCGFVLVGGLAGRPVGVFNAVLPPDFSSWIAHDDLEKAEEASRKEGKPLFIEFTGVT